MACLEDFISARGIGSVFNSAYTELSNLENMLCPPQSRQGSPLRSCECSTYSVWSESICGLVVCPTGDTEEVSLCHSRSWFELFRLPECQRCVHSLYSSTRSSSEVGAEDAGGIFHVTAPIAKRNFDNPGRAGRATSAGSCTITDGMKYGTGGGGHRNSSKERHLDSDKFSQ